MLKTGGREIAFLDREASERKRPDLRVDHEDILFFRKVKSKLEKGGIHQ